MAASAPSFRQASHFACDPAVAYTREPSARANWMAVVPMPLVPPWTSTDSPGCSRPMSNRLAQTVKKVSGRAPARTAS